MRTVSFSVVLVSFLACGQAPDISDTTSEQGLTTATSDIRTFTVNGRRYTVDAFATAGSIGTRITVQALTGSKADDGTALLAFGKGVRSTWSSAVPGRPPITLTPTLPALADPLAQPPLEKSVGEVIAQAKSRSSDADIFIAQMEEYCRENPGAMGCPQYVTCDTLKAAAELTDSWFHGAVYRVFC
ncbi:MAG: hypothetical protein IT381_02185 [Deltaproteobacteria bacterium]|nr:hypothetical protein [Deltaproteobacteria bacterium]